MKSRKLKVKKFEKGGYGGFDGTESLNNEGFGSVGLEWIYRYRTWRIFKKCWKISHRRYWTKFFK
jgi:hypothetical protein